MIKTLYKIPGHPVTNSNIRNISCLLLVTIRSG